MGLLNQALASLVRMTVADLFPAAGIGAFVSLSLAAAQVLPLGAATVLVRAPAPRDAAIEAAVTGAELVAIPAPGFAVLRGDAARIRHWLGLAVVWRGGALCSTRP